MGLCTWEKLNKNKYYVVPLTLNGIKSAGMVEFYEHPDKWPMSTPSVNLILFGTTGQAFPDDDERPPVPHWIEKGKAMMRGSPAGELKIILCWSALTIQWRVHAQLDDINWFHEIVTGK